MSVNAFTPMGNTVAFTAFTTAPTPVQATSASAAATQYLVQNSGNAVVFLGVGATSATANSNAATVTSTGASIPLLPTTVQVLTFNANAYFTGVASANCGVYITPGDGI